MGNCLKKKQNQTETKYKEKEGSKEEVKNSEQQAQVAKPAKKKVDIQKYRFVNRSNQLLVIPPGQIEGQCFQIDNCVNCEIFILDNSAQVFVDEVKDSQVFVGPCSSSVFVRNCSNSQFQIICGQFRSRDNINCDVLLFCQTQPGIQSSSQIRFGCFNYYYPQLYEQMEKAGLSSWNNNWSDIHNFTPNHLYTEGPNYTYLPQDFPPEDIVQGIDKLPDYIKANFSTIRYKEDDSVEGGAKYLVPVTQGKRIKNITEGMLIMLYPEFVDLYQGKLSGLARVFNDSEVLNMFLIKSREYIAFQEEIMAIIATSPSCTNALKSRKLESKRIIFMLIGGFDCQASFYQEMDAVIGGSWDQQKSNYCYEWTQIEEINKLNALIFEAWMMDVRK